MIIDGKFCESTWNTFATQINNFKECWSLIQAKQKASKQKAIMRIHASRNCRSRFQNVVINWPEELIEWSQAFETAKPSFEVVKAGW